MFRFCTLKEHYAQQHNNVVEKTNKNAYINCYVILSEWLEAIVRCKGLLST